MCAAHASSHCKLRLCCCTVEKRWAAASGAWLLEGGSSGAIAAAAPPPPAQAAAPAASRAPQVGDDQHCKGDGLHPGAVLHLLLDGGHGCTRGALGTPPACCSSISARGRCCGAARGGQQPRARPIVLQQTQRPVGWEGTAQTTCTGSSNRWVQRGSAPGAGRFTRVTALIGLQNGRLPGAPRPSQMPQGDVDRPMHSPQAVQGPVGCRRGGRRLPRLRSAVSRQMPLLPSLVADHHPNNIQLHASCPLLQRLQCAAT